MAGTGVYKSTDAGKTRAHVGLAGRYTIGRIRIHSKNPDVAYVAVWDLQIHPRDNMIVIATNGRGMWVLDDASPLQK
jgi:hypothetical protein